jgi:hemoglobin-like flavoprotein
MTPEQIRIVQSTWLKMLPIQFTTAQLFYRRLFELDPSLRRLFRGSKLDMDAQGQKLMQVIDAAVNGLSRMERVVPMIQALGRRHAAYGVKDEHYGTVGAALLWTLGRGLGAGFTPEVKDAWTSAYGMLATTMREAARDASGEGRPPVESKPAGSEARLAMESSHAAATTQAHTRTIVVVSVLALAAAAGLGYAAAGDVGKDLTTAIARPHQLPIAAGPQSATNPTRFLLNALLVPALDTDALPLRWADPRGPSQCGANTTVRVNGEPLLAGALVPNQPFEIEWQADACRPFGKAGPRYDGQVKLTVYREDWGFSARVEPKHLRITSANNAVTLVRAGAVSLPPQGDPDKPVTRSAACADGARLCL